MTFVSVSQACLCRIAGVLQIMGLSFTILQWYFDGACLWSWALQTVDGVPLSSFGMPSAARRIRKACFGEIAVTGWGAATNRAPLRDGCCGSATCVQPSSNLLSPDPSRLILNID